MSPQSIESLGPKMEARLGELETVIRDGLRAFVRVGDALTEIRDDRLYMARYDSFEQYVNHRWSLSRSRAYQLIESAQIVELLGEGLRPRTNGGPSTKLDTPPPKNDTQVRALAPLKEEPDVLRETWKTLHEEHGDELTADTVTRAVRARVAERERISAPPEAPEDPTPPEDEPQAQTTRYAVAIRAPEDETPSAENLRDLIHMALEDAGYAIEAVDAREDA